MGRRGPGRAARRAGDPRGDPRVRRPRADPRGAGSRGCGRRRPLPLGEPVRCRDGTPERGARGDGRRPRRRARDRRPRAPGRAPRADGRRAPERGRGARVGQRLVPRRRAVRRVLGGRGGDRCARLRPSDDARLLRSRLRPALPLEHRRQPGRDDDYGGAPRPLRRPRRPPPPAHPARARRRRDPRAPRTLGPRADVPPSWPRRDGRPPSLPLRHRRPRRRGVARARRVRRRRPVLCGADYPFDMGSEHPAEIVRALGLPAEDETAILAGNALRLLGREVAA